MNKNKQIKDILSRILGLNPWRCDNEGDCFCIYCGGIDNHKDDCIFVEGTNAINEQN